MSGAADDIDPAWHPAGIDHHQIRDRALHSLLSRLWWITGLRKGSVLFFAGEHFRPLLNRPRSYRRRSRAGYRRQHHRTFHWNRERHVWSVRRYHGWDRRCFDWRFLLLLLRFFFFHHGLRFLLLFRRSKNHRDNFLRRSHGPLDYFRGAQTNNSDQEKRQTNRIHPGKRAIRILEFRGQTEARQIIGKLIALCAAPESRRGNGDTGLGHKGKTKRSKSPTRKSGVLYPFRCPARYSQELTPDPVPGEITQSTGNSRPTNTM